MGKKANSKKYNFRLATFLSMMPIYLTGEEFKYKDDSLEEMCKSPVGKISAIIANNGDRFSTFVDVEDSWVGFNDDGCQVINFYENVIKHLLEEDLFPFILIYKVCPCPLQRPNKEAREIIYHYMNFFEGKKGKEENKAKATQVDEREESKGEIGRLYLFLLLTLSNSSFFYTLCEAFIIANLGFYSISSFYG